MRFVHKLKNLRPFKTSISNLIVTDKALKKLRGHIGLWRKTTLTYLPRFGQMKDEMRCQMVDHDVP